MCVCVGGVDHTWWLGGVGDGYGGTDDGRNGSGGGNDGEGLVFHPQFEIFI